MLIIKFMFINIDLMRRKELQWSTAIMVCCSLKMLYVCNSFGSGRLDLYNRPTRRWFVSFITYLFEFLKWQTVLSLYLNNKIVRSRLSSKLNLWFDHKEKNLLKNSKWLRSSRWPSNHELDLWFFFLGPQSYKKGPI
jgi:hypothetical protein